MNGDNQNIIDCLTQENYLNDLEFALAYVRSRLI
ncbi:RecX family transcriptional regulator [Anaerobacillus sp. HL2]|nr:RecX family transcriptional regulator [Anaerobacillus sp. HL2]